METDLLVEHIMTKDVIFVSLEEPVKKVAELLTKNRIHGVPVVKDGTVAGIITESDFFIKNLTDVYLPSYIEFLKQTKLDYVGDNKIKRGIRELIEAKAEDIMSSPCITAYTKDKISDIIELIKNKKLTTIPVIDSEEKLAGIITTADIIKLI